MLLTSSMTEIKMESEIVKNIDEFYAKGFNYEG